MAISGFEVRVSIAYHQLAGQTASSTAIVRAGANLCFSNMSAAAANSATPEITISSIGNGKNGGISHKNALGFTRCKMPDAPKAKTITQLPIGNPASVLRATAPRRQLQI